MGLHNNPRGTKEIVVGEECPLLLPRKIDEKLQIQDEVSNSKGASFTGSVFNLSTTIIGAGIMALPAAMKVLGLAMGIAAIIFLAVITETSLDILMRFSRVSKAQTYGEVMGYAFGNAGRFVLQISVLINNFGILVVYMIIIGDVLSGTSSSGIHHFGVLEGWFGEQWWTGRTFVLLVATIFVFTPLGFFKRICTFLL